jgi:hypothetical protein
VRELAQLRRRALELRRGGFQGRVGRQLRAEELQRQGQRHEPLLGAVVQVALEPPPLGVARLDDAGTRCAQLVEPRAHLSLEALVLESEAGRRRHLVHQLLVVEDARRVAEHRDRPAVADERRALLPGTELDGPALRVDEPPGRAERVREHELRIADDAGESVA